MNIAYADQRSRGVDKLSPKVGRLACEHLVARLQRNESGLPADPEISAVEGTWVEDYGAWKSARDKWRVAAAVKVTGHTRSARSGNVEAVVLNAST
jgi:hypothetical protein